MNQEIVIHIVTCSADRNSEYTEGTNWVDALVHFLKLSLMQFQGREPRVEVHEEKLGISKLEVNEVVVPIISPNFITNEKLVGDLAYLSGKVQAALTGRKSFFKIIKVPVEQKQLPPELRELLAYNFFYLDEEAGLIREYTQFAMLDSSNAFWATLVDLTYDILEAVLPEHSRMMNVGKGRYVFLAETTYFLQIQRKVVKRELSRYGYQVLPDTAPSSDPKELKEETLEALAKSEFSIHLIGEDRGHLLENSEDTIAEIQLDLANEYAEKELDSSGKSFNRLIWLPPNIKPQDDRQRLFIDELREHADVTQGIEIVQVKLEDFKSMLLRQLALQTKQAASLVQKEQGEDDEKEQVYLVADAKDIEKLNPIANWYEKQKSIVYWIGNNPLASHRDRHIEYLNNCDICIISYYHSSEAWLVTKLQDILKSPGLGRKKPTAQSAIITFDKQHFQQAREILDRYPQYHKIQLILAEGEGASDQLEKLWEEKITQE